MPRPRVYRDPVHGQIKFRRANLSNPIPDTDFSEERLGWLIPHLINCTEFQRLRHIRQNGLTNLVFHGMEHSRFSHSMGVTYLAREMYDRVVDNMGEKPDPEKRLATITAALVHDVGHGPFSHTMEEVLELIGVPFHHERLTQRIIEDPGTQINAKLREVDGTFPATVAAFIDKSKRREDHWTYRLVTSQLDSDRLDYLLRDTQFAGVRGHGFDLARLLDMLHHLDGIRIAVDRHAMEAVEAYLLMLEQVYRAIYFHRSVRSATVLLKSVLQRAVDLYRADDLHIFSDNVELSPNPVRALIDGGEAIEVGQYLRLGEYQVWSLIEGWQWHNDRTLSDLATRLMQRRIFRAVDLDQLNYAGITKLSENTKVLIKQRLPHVTDELLKYYVVVDEATRAGYKRYDWRSPNPDESIWMIGGSDSLIPIEDDPNSKIVTALKQTRHFDRLVFPHEVLDEVRRLNEGAT